MCFYSQNTSKMDLTTEFSFSESNYTNQTTSDDAQNTQKINLFSLYVFLIILSIFANIYVIYIALGQLRNSKRQKRVTTLIAHLSLVSICTIVSHSFNTSNTSGMLAPSESLCSWLAYWKSVFTSAFSLNSTFIVHEQLRSMKQTKANENRVSVAGVVAIIWLISMIFNIPTAMMTKPGDLIESCETVNLMNNPTATLVYEVLRFKLFSVIGVPYIVYALVKVRPILRFLREESKTGSQRMKQLNRSIRIIYFHLAAMAILWIPGGLAILAHRFRLNIAEYLESWPILLNIVYTAVMLLLILFSIVNPCISLYLLDNQPIKFKFGFCCKDRTDSSANIESGDITLADLRTSNIEQIDNTEIATRLTKNGAVSLEQNHDNNLVENGTPVTSD